MRGTIILKILEILSEGAVEAIDLLEAFLSAGYGASSGKIDYELFKIKKERAQRAERNEERKVSRAITQRYYTMLYKLKKEGLVEKRRRGQDSFFVITLRGKRKLQQLKKRQNEKIPETHYSGEKTVDFIIVIFDIPETEKGKRVWLRSALKNLGFTKLQKSVWIGKVKIPEEFLRDLKRLRLTTFVEIFEISKIGSIEHIA